MGLLDEAIREHLELKRRRGADPTEVERLEREALGPVRRIQQESAGDEALEPADEIRDQELLADDEDDRTELGLEPEYADEPADYAHEPEYEYAPPVEDVEPEALEPPPAPGPDSAETHGVVPPPEPEPMAEEEPEPVESPRSDRPVYQDPGVETAEYDVEAEHAEENDVLEETPEFLQDAPDHDRLWFEQRPPKDFDFDG